MNGEAIRPSSASVLDQPALLARVGGDEALLIELTEMFAQECPDRLRSIRRAVDGRDPAGLRRVAHQFRGALALFGARHAVEATRRLELMAQDGAFDSAHEVCDVLYRETQRLLTALGYAVPGA